MKQSRLFSYLFCFLAFAYTHSLGAQKAMAVESFSELVLTGIMNVELKIADKEEVIIETKGIEVEDIGVNVKGGVLKINALKAFKNKNIEINITIYHKNLYSISASAGAMVTKRATGGMIDGKKLEVERAYVVSSTGASILVKAISELDIRANTGGNVTYYGTPVKKTIKKVMAGEVVNEY
jgi:hypothetical protein